VRARLAGMQLLLWGLVSGARDVRCRVRATQRPEVDNERFGALATTPTQPKPFTTAGPETQAPDAVPGAGTFTSGGAGDSIRTGGTEPARGPGGT
jgi:hypothetical protein